MRTTIFVSAFVGITLATLFYVFYIVLGGQNKSQDIIDLISRMSHLKMQTSDNNPSRKDNERRTEIIHQSWKTHELPQRFKKWRATWQKCFPTWEMKLWDDKDNRNLLQNHYPWFIPYYDSFTSHIHRVDSVRYFYLFHYGGIYTDLDNECLKPFPHLLKNYSLVFGAMNGQYGSYIKEGYVQNSLMYSRPRHPFWMEMIHEVMKRVKSPQPPEAIAGPITLVHSINMYRKRHTDDIKIYPPKFFNPNNWMKSRKDGCKDFNKMTEADEERCRESHKDSYVIQYHTQTWGRGKVTRR